MTKTLAQQAAAAIKRQGRHQTRLYGAKFDLGRGQSVYPPVPDDLPTYWDVLRSFAYDEGSVTNDEDGLCVSFPDGSSLLLGFMEVVTWQAGDMLTPMEAAALTGIADNTWRWRAAHGKVPGAILKGKQWLLPRSVVAATPPD